MFFKRKIFKKRNENVMCTGKALFCGRFMCVCVFSYYVKCISCCDCGLFESHQLEGRCGVGLISEERP